MLTDWWTQLEATPRFGGPRRHIQRLLGKDLTILLEETNILRQGKTAPTFPCSKRRGDGCPRTIIQFENEYHAVCGNRPSECSDLIMSEHDVAQLSLNILVLCNQVGAALSLRGKPEKSSDLANIYRVGSVITGPGVKYPVYLASRLSAQEYTEVLGAIAAQQNGSAFVMLVPTNEFLTDTLEHQARSLGVIILALGDVMAVENGKIVTSRSPEHLFASLGQHSSAGFNDTGVTVARAMVCDGKTARRWINLDEQGYQALIAEKDNYDVFADQRQHSVWKTGTLTKAKVPDSNFSTVMAAIKSRAYYDPNTTGPDLTAGKQVFQRARPIFDPRTGKSPWRIFQSIKHEDGHMVYAFKPEAGVSFAYLFLPEV
ncbi:MAG: hypothetical protein HOB79_19300 [Rhodospirillaceae bacterium]|jgi:hypothetical protein|nr:hypothetical protein [Rhodospirillaceae bacterium]